MKYPESIRPAGERSSWKKDLLISIGILASGCILGLFSKYLDHFQADLPPFLARLDRAADLHNYLGAFAPWLFLAFFIAVYARSPLRAALNVFLFFAGMVVCYYLFSKYVAGFFPGSYAMIWAGLTVISPLPAVLCWYARGRGPVSLVLSAGILGAFLDMSFDYGMFYLSLRSLISLAVLIPVILILRKPSYKENLIMAGLAILLAILIRSVFPFGL